MKTVREDDLRTMIKLRSTGKAKRKPHFDEFGRFKKITSSRCDSLPPATRQRQLTLEPADTVLLVWLHCHQPMGDGSVRVAMERWNQSILLKMKFANLKFQRFRDYKTNSMSQRLNLRPGELMCSAMGRRTCTSDL